MLEHVGFTSLVRVQFEAKRLQAVFAQAAVDDVEGGTFFRDEEDAFSLGKAVGYDVGDRLRFTGSGRTFEDVVMTGSRCHDSGELRGVGTARAVDVARVELVVELRRFDVVGRIRILSASIVNKMVHDAVAGEFFEAIRDVFPEKKFGEGKLTEPYLGLYLPADQVTDGVTEKFKYTSDVYATVVLGQRVETRNLLLEILPEHFHEGNVEARLFVDASEGEAFEHGLAFQFYRHEQDRRT